MILIRFQTFFCPFFLLAQVGTELKNEKAGNRKGKNKI